MAKRAKKTSNFKEVEKMKLLIAFGTNDGKNLKGDDHVSISKYFDMYRFFENKEEFVGRRENVKFKGDESMKHGDPRKAKKILSQLRFHPLSESFTSSVGHCRKR